MNEVIIKTFDEIYAEFYADLVTFGSQISNTEPGGHYDQLIRISCRILADAYTTLGAALNISFLDYATAEWLDLKAAEFGTSRQAATKTIKEFKLTRTSTTGTLQVPIGDIIKTPVIPLLGQLRYFSIISDKADYAAAGLAGQFEDGEGEIYVRFEAEQPGSDYNNIEERLDVSTVTMEIESGLTGVDGVESTGEDAEPGTNAETDAELRARLKERWAVLATGATRAAYIGFAKDSHASVYDANISGDQPGGHPTDVEVVVSGPPGNRALDIGIKVYPADNFNSLYTDDGTPGGDQTIGTDIHEYIRARAPLTDYVYLKTVTETSQNLTLEIKVLDGFEFATVQADLETRLQALFLIERDVEDVTPLKVGEDLLFSVLTRICTDTAGFKDFKFTVPDPGVNDGNIDVDLDEVLTKGTITITEMT